MVRTKKTNDETALDLKWLRDIEKAERECQTSEIILLKAREDMKSAKELHSGNVYALRSLIKAGDNDKQRPLFNQKKPRGRSKNQVAKLDGASVVPEPVTAKIQRKKGEIIGAPPDWKPSDDSWRSESVDALKLTGSIITSLAVKNVATLGDLVDFVKSGKSLLDLDLSERQASKIEVAMVKFWQRREVAKTDGAQP
jgi:hypothetical protein